MSNTGRDLVEDAGGEDGVLDQRREQILKLVTRAFFKELRRYGIKEDEIVRVASHLLDNILSQKEGPRLQGRNEERPLTDVEFTIDAVSDDWEHKQTLSLDRVSLRPFAMTLVPRVEDWLRPAGVRDSFVSPFPETQAGLRDYFARPNQAYFAIHYDGTAVGIIGGENIDHQAEKLEMKKLVGDPDMRGKGIGKRATFLFLHHAFSALRMHKVYVHSRDINVRNINLNAGFGFELEGAFLEDTKIAGQRVDLVRMALLAPIWDALFASAR
jgi:RimJ/RimL family protein N-acetyltransferase